MRRSLSLARYEYARQLRTLTTVFVFGLGVTASTFAYANSRDVAHRMHNRLTGVPAAADVLQQMSTLIDENNAFGAAMLALENPNFYDTKLLGWVLPWTNVDESSRVELNDYVATVIGAIRDEIPFSQLLYEDILYIGTADNLSPYSLADNDHYGELSNSGVSLKDSLQRRSQSELNEFSETAGIFTTRGFGEAYYSAGTNRRALRFAMMTFLCRDMEALSDTSVPDFRIRRDVDRSPGGDSQVFRSKCAGCHAGMDALAGAFAFLDFEDGELSETFGEVQDKINQNGTTFPDGFVSQDSQWVNLWKEGQNSVLGWPDDTSGEGIKSLGQMLARTEAFPLCMATKVHQAVCLEKPNSDRAEELASEFVAAEFSMKSLFAHTAATCLQDQKGD